MASLFSLRFQSLAHAGSMTPLMGSAAPSCLSFQSLFSTTTSPLLVDDATPTFSTTELVRDMRRGLNGCGAGLQVSRAPKKIARSKATLVARTAAVHTGLDSQVKRRADYRKTLPSKPSRSGLLQYIKKNAWEKE